MVGIVVLFSFLPVPFSAVMLQRQISSWSKFDFSYVSRSTWVNENEISPQIYLVVIASEDQNFPKHWGFDFDAIEKVFKNSLQKLKNDTRCLYYFTTNGQKLIFVGWA